jgi:23S rRNA pseudouridine2605 synthase
MAMTRRPGPPANGRRDRARSGPASPSRRPKSGSAGFGAKKDFGDRKSGGKAFGEKKFGDKKPAEKRFSAKGLGEKRFGGQRANDTGHRPRFSRPAADRNGADRHGTDRHGETRPRPDRPRAPAAPREGREDTRRSRFPDVQVPARGRDNENRIAKVMARAGLCSRREAEDWIAAGRVAVNGGTISSPAINVTERDRVTVDGEPLPRRERTRLFLYHKPAGLVSTNSDPEGRPTLFDALPTGLPRLISVGRLDIGTEGLLLLTNDGGLARELELPETGWVRRYRVRAHGHVSQDELDKLRDGVTVDGIHYGPIEATLERDQGGANVWISFAISEGKNREVRNVLAHLGLDVNRLIRVEFGPFGLGALPEGEIEEVETGNLRAQLGARIVARAGCDFSGPATALAGQNREERREQRHALRERIGDARRRLRDSDEESARDARGLKGRPFRESRGEWDEAPEKPAGRPRRGHAWRQEDAPLHRTYRGSRREDLNFADEERPDRRIGETTDRKGRSVVVERFGTPKEEPEPISRPSRGPRRGPPRDRASGPRPSRPRFGDERAEERGGEGRFGRPRKFGAREDRRDGERGDKPMRSQRPRFSDERGGEGAGRPRRFGARSESRRDGKPGDKPGPRGSRPSGGRPPGSRPSGKRPPRDR